MARKPRIPWFSADAAVSEIARLSGDMQSAGAKERIKLGRRLAFAAASIAHHSERAGLDAIEIGLAAIQHARRSGARMAGMHRAAAVLSRQRLRVMGCGEATVRAEVRKSIVVNSACLCAGEPGTSLDIGTAADLLVDVNAGRGFVIETGCDGRFPVSLRLVDAPEPVLRPNDYPHLENSTEMGQVIVKGRALHFGALENLENGARVEVEPGRYLVRAFDLGNRIILVAVPSVELVPTLMDLPSLG